MESKVTTKRNELWQEKLRVLNLGDGEFVSFRVSDFGNLGVKFDLQCGVEHIAFLIEPKSVDVFLNWFATVGCREVLALPPKAKTTLETILQADRAKSFLAKTDRITMKECVASLTKMESLRDAETQAELLSRARQRI